MSEERNRWHFGAHIMSPCRFFSIPAYVKTCRPLLWLAAFLLLCGSGCDSGKRPAPQVIFDTDISSDVDDVGAVAVLHALADRNEVGILAMAVSSGDPWSVPCLHALNAWFGRNDIPVGKARERAVTHESLYTKKIVEEFGGVSDAESAEEDAVDLYRRILASQPDGSVTIVTVGYLTNLAGLIHSPADAHSNLDGRSLVRQKVKRLVCMGGEFPTGREWNLYQDTASTKAVVEGWPTPIVFSGFEIGKDIMTGAGLRESRKDNPVRRAYELYNNLQNRQSWDQVTVLYAVRMAGDTDDPAFAMQPGKIRVSDDGANSWQADDPAGQAYLKRRIPAGDLASDIEQLMTAR